MRRIEPASSTSWCPRENEKDVKDIPSTVLKSVEIQFVEHMDDVLRAALVLEDPENFLKPRAGEGVLPTPNPVAQADVVTH